MFLGLGPGHGCLILVECLAVPVDILSQSPNWVMGLESWQPISCYIRAGAGINLPIVSASMTRLGDFLSFGLLFVRQSASFGPNWVIVEYLYLHF